MENSKRKTIQLNSHVVTEKAIQYVTDVLKSGWTGLGPMVDKFEQACVEYLNTKYAIALSSGTAALEMALWFINGRPGDVVVTTPYTFVSTNHSIIKANFIPVFADVEPDTGNIDAESVKRLVRDPFLRDRVRAIMVVHFAGQPVDMDAIYDIANDLRIDVIEDAAHAFGAKYDGDKIGSFYSRLVAFSFHSVKPLAIGDGGLLTTNDEYVYETARKLRWCGIDRSTAVRTSSNRYIWDYNVEFVGFKSHMNSIQAAIGLGQLESFDEHQRHRQMLVDRYLENFKNIQHITPLARRDKRESANHLFVIRCNDPNDKSKLMDYLQDHDIQTGCHYRPSIMYRMYHRYATDNGCPNAINLFESAISLPLHLRMSIEDVDLICEKIQDYFRDK